VSISGRRLCYRIGQIGILGQTRNWMKDIHMYEFVYDSSYMALLKPAVVIGGRNVDTRI
jgi:hypothetical protein